MVYASHFTHAVPRGFGDNYLSGHFENLDNVDFDSADFMPEFDFDGFFKKIDTQDELKDLSGNYDAFY